MKLLYKKFILIFIIFLMQSFVIIETVQSRELDVPFHRQNTNVWCWAATIAMVGEYVTGNRKEDCEVLAAYDRALGGFGACCTNPVSCYRTGSLTEMKNILRTFFGLSGRHFTRSLTYSELKREIDNDRPFIISLQSSNGGHVVVVIGYTSSERVILLDPISGRHVVPYSQVLNNFELGYWTNTLTVNNTNSSISSQPPQSSGAFCCDYYGYKRCQATPNNTSGSQCFCPGQGYGNVCH